MIQGIALMRWLRRNQIVKRLFPATLSVKVEVELTSCTFSGTENQGFRQLNKHSNAHRENRPSPLLSSGSLPEHLLEPLPSLCTESVLVKFPGNASSLTAVSGSVPRVDAKILCLSSFRCCWFLFLPPDPTFAGLWESPHLLSSMFPFRHIASSLLAISLFV